VYIWGKICLDSYKEDNGSYDDSISQNVNRQTYFVEKMQNRFRSIVHRQKSELSGQIASMIFQLTDRRSIRYDPLKFQTKLQSKNKLERAMVNTFIIFRQSIENVLSFKGTQRTEERTRRDLYLSVYDTYVVSLFEIIFFSLSKYH